MKTKNKNSKAENDGTANTDAQIIVFPKSKIVRIIPDKTEQENAAKYHRRNAERFVSYLCENILGEISEIEEIDVKQMHFQKDFSYTIEVLRATIYRSFGLEHPLQEYLDKNVEVATPEEMEKLHNGEPAPVIDKEGNEWHLPVVEE